MVSRRIMPSAANRSKAYVQRHKTETVKKSETAKKSESAKKSEIKIPTNIKGVHKKTAAKIKSSTRKIPTYNVTIAQIQEWKKGLSQTPMKTFEMMAQSLKYMLRSMNYQKGNVASATIHDPAVFNGMVKLCLNEVPNVLLRLCNSKHENINNKKRYQKWESVINSYLKTLILLLKQVTDPTSVELILLKGILPILPFYIAMEEICRALMEQLAVLWATIHENLTTSTFVIFLRILKGCSTEFCDDGIQIVYLAYLHNSRFTSPTTWPMINLMRKTLSELFLLDEGTAYRHGFIHLKKIAFHVRNALDSYTKAKNLMVMNWQVVHALHLWADVLSKYSPSKIMLPLTHALAQICIGALNLRRLTLFLPFKFHIINIITTKLSGQTNFLIPVINSILEVLSYKELDLVYDIESITKVPWDCKVRLSNDDCQDIGFSDRLIEKFNKTLLAYLSTESASIYFPELCLPATIQIKRFIKNSKNSYHQKMLNQLLEKIQRNVDFIEGRRNKIAFKNNNFDAVRAWEIETKQANPPIDAAYEKTKEGNVKIVKIQAEIDAFSLPAIAKEAILKAQAAGEDEDMSEDDIVCTMQDESDIEEEEEKADVLESKEEISEDEEEKADVLESEEEISEDEEEKADVLESEEEISEDEEEKADVLESEISEDEEEKADVLESEEEISEDDDQMDEDPVTQVTNQEEATVSEDDDWKEKFI